MLRIHGDFIKQKIEEMSSGVDEKETQRQSRQQRQNQIFAMHCKNFARIAKISQP